MISLKFLLVLVLAIGAINSAKVSYKGYRLLRLQPTTPEQSQLIFEWESNDNDFDVWARSKQSDELVDVSLSPRAFLRYKVLFITHDIKYSVVQQDLQQIFDEQEMRMNISSRADQTIIGKYARYSQIQTFLIASATENPSFVSTYVAGKSHENRDLRVIEIGQRGNQKHIWIDCGIHAREWVSPATCMWIINSLINEYNAGNALTTKILNYYTIHVLPLVNPDGYEYTHNTMRLWRKNRRPNTGSTCVGTDLNRNYGYNWLTGGSSTNPCSDTYAGPSKDSEPETKAVEAAINAKLGQWDSFLTLHSYGLWWFTTWGYTTVAPPNLANLVAKAKVGTDGITAVHGTKYTYGQSSTMLYIASGGSEDWAQGTAGIKYAYCLELRPGQTGVDAIYGFELPEDRAPNTGRETYEGIKAYLNHIITNY